MGNPTACTANAAISPAAKILVLMGIFFRECFFADSFSDFALMVLRYFANALKINLCTARHALRSRSALETTDNELKLMASAAIIGDRSHPVSGYNTPAANGTPSAL